VLGSVSSDLPTDTCPGRIGWQQVSRLGREEIRIITPSTCQPTDTLDFILIFAPAITRLIKTGGLARYYNGTEIVPFYDPGPPEHKDIRGLPCYLPRPPYIGKTPRTPRANRYRTDCILFARRYSVCSGRSIYFLYRPLRWHGVRECTRSRLTQWACGQTTVSNRNKRYRLPRLSCPPVYLVFGLSRN